MKKIIGEERLKNILISDKKQNPERMVKIIKSEMLYLLRNYFELCDEDLSVSIAVNSSNMYDVNINFLANSLKVAKTF